MKKLKQVITDEFKDKCIELCSARHIVSKRTNIPNEIFEFGFDRLTMQDQLIPTGKIKIKETVDQNGISSIAFSLDYSVDGRFYYYLNTLAHETEDQTIHLTFMGRVADDLVVYDTKVIYQQ